MYNNLQYMMFNNSYIDYYIGNNFLLKQENNLLKKDLDKVTQKYNKLMKNYKHLQDVIVELEDKINIITSEHDKLRNKFVLYDNEIVDEFEKI
jgi:predicted  nucleic acid-binding Zn-ribbon protein